MSQIIVKADIDLASLDSALLKADIPMQVEVKEKLAEGLKLALDLDKVGDIIHVNIVKGVKKFYCERNDCKGLPGCDCVGNVGQQEKFRQFAECMVNMPEEYQVLIKNAMMIVLGKEVLAPDIDSLELEARAFMGYITQIPLDEKYMPLAIKQYGADNENS